MRPWRWWTGLLARKESGESLAIFRVLVGVGALWSLLVPLRYDVWILTWTNSGYRPGAPDQDTVAMVLGAGLLACACVVLGLGGRVAAFVALQCCLWVHGINPNDNGAHDRYISNGLWLLVLAGSTATWSLDCRLRTGRWSSDAQVASWPRYLAILQIFWAYQATGIQKVSPEWTPFGDFSALWYILRSPVWMRFDSGWMPYWFTQVSTAVTWTWEWCAWVFLYAFWCRDTKPRQHWANRIDLRSIWAAWGVAMHTVLFFVAVLGPLQWITVAWYAALYHPHEVRRAIAALRRRLGAGEGERSALRA